MTCAPSRTDTAVPKDGRSPRPCLSFAGIRPRACGDKPVVNDRSWPSRGSSGLNLLAVNQPFIGLHRLEFRHHLEWRVVAGWVRSPTAASENSSSLNLGLADWPLSGSRYFRFGSPAANEELRVIWRLYDAKRPLAWRGASIRRIDAVVSILRTNLAVRAWRIRKLSRTSRVGANNQIGRFIKARRSTTWAHWLKGGALGTIRSWWAWRVDHLPPR